MGESWHSELRKAENILKRALREADELQDDACSPNGCPSPLDDRVQIVQGSLRYALQKTRAVASLAERDGNKSPRNGDDFEARGRERTGSRFASSLPAWQ